jgi:hypothetical protein
MFVFAFMLAAVFGWLAWKIPADTAALTGIKVVFAVAAFGAGFYGLTQLAEYMIWLWGEANDSRYPVRLASVISGMSPEVASIWQRHTATEVIGFFGPGLSFEWRIRAMPVDVDWDFAQQYIEACRAYYPHAAPIGRAYEITDSVNAERQAKALIDRLIEQDVVLPAKGNQSAIFVCPWEDIAAAFGIEP